MWGIANKSPLALFSLFTLFAGCQEENQPAPVDVQVTTPEQSISILEPIDRDLPDIRERGVLKIITNYSSNTYFLHQGIEAGFEYELLQEFAKENDLALEIIVMDHEQNPYDLLNSGEGDVIAANYTVTPERKKAVSFTRPYNLVDQQIIFSGQVQEPPQTLQEVADSGIPVTVARNSSYFHTLIELQEQGYDLNIQVVPEDLNTEDLLFQVSKNRIKATVSDDNIHKAMSRYIPGLEAGPNLSERDSIAWAVRHTSRDLQTAMNRFLYKHFRFTAGDLEPKRSEFLNILRRRYFERGSQIADYFQTGHFEATGFISPYDQLVQSVADSLELDWLMLTSMIAQESKFKPLSKSHAGAVGLMQIIPRFSDVEYVNLYEPEINILEGARILKDHLNHYAYMDSVNQWSFALATYNVGKGHMADARRLVIDQNKNPNEWKNVSEALLKLMQRRYYQDVRYGYARGIETVRYVEEIKNRYRTYNRILTVAENRGKIRRSGAVEAVVLSLP